MRVKGQYKRADIICIVPLFLFELHTLRRCLNGMFLFQNILFMLNSWLVFCFQYLAAGLHCRAFKRGQCKHTCRVFMLPLFDSKCSVPINMTLCMLQIHICESSSTSLQRNFLLFQKRERGRERKKERNKEKEKEKERKRK